MKRINMRTRAAFLIAELTMRVAKRDEIGVDDARKATLAWFGGQLGFRCHDLDNVSIRDCGRLVMLCHEKGWVKKLKTGG